MDKLISIPGIESFQYNIKEDSYTLRLENDTTILNVKFIAKQLQAISSNIEVVSILGDQGIELKIKETVKQSYACEVN